MDEKHLKNNLDILECELNEIELKSKQTSRRRDIDQLTIKLSNIKYKLKKNMFILGKNSESLSSHESALRKELNKLHQKLFKIEIFLSSKEKFYFEDTKKRRKFRFLSIIASYLIIFPLLFFMSVAPQEYYSKIRVEQAIITALNNNIEARSLHSILETLPPEKKRIIDSLKAEYNMKNEAIYKKPISLEKVLINIRNQNYLEENFNEELDKKLRSILKDVKQVSPLENLSPIQAESFMNIKTKLSEESYRKIESDIFKVIDELTLKSNLVNIYLAQSDESYTMSVIALIIAIVTLIPLTIQFLQFIFIFIVKLKTKESEKEKEIDDFNEDDELN